MSEINDIKKIVLATDFSEVSKKALSVAQLMAKKMNADLIIVHVFDERFVGTLHSIHSPVLGNLVLDYRSKGEKDLEEFCKGVEYKEKHFLEGHPAKKLIEFIENNQVDMLVMGTHGHTGLDRFVMGSIAEYVVRRAPCPVTTVKGKL